MKQKVLVTGALGFVGSYLCELLLKDDYTLRIIDDLDPQAHPNGAPQYKFKDQVEWIRSPLEKISSWEDILNGVDVIIHQASRVGVVQSQYQIAHYCEGNVMGTAGMLDFLANNSHQVKKIIVASSMSTYGEGRYQTQNGAIVNPAMRGAQEVESFGFEPVDPQTKRPLKALATTESDPQKPTTIYAVNKMTQEMMVHCFGQSYGVPTVALRYFNIYGPRQSLSNPYTGAFAIFMSRIKNGSAPTVYEDGKQTRDFVFVEDIARANLLALEASFTQAETFNIGSGSRHSILEAAKQLCEAMESSLTPEVTQQFRKGDVRHCFADISHAQAKLGYNPQFTLDKGLEKLLDWAKTQEAKDDFQKAEAELKKRNLV